MYYVTMLKKEILIPTENGNVLYSRYIRNRLILTQDAQRYSENS